MPSTIRSRQATAKPLRLIKAREYRSVLTCASLIMNKTLSIIVAIVAALIAYLVGMALIFPMIASSGGIYSSSLGDFIGFWGGSKPKEYYSIDSVSKFLGLHGFGLIVAFAAFQSIRKKTS